MYRRVISKERSDVLLARALQDVLDFLEKVTSESHSEELVLLHDSLKPTIDHLLRRKHGTSKSIQANNE